MIRNFATLFIFYYYLCDDNPLNKAYHFASDRWPATPPVLFENPVENWMCFSNVLRSGEIKTQIMARGSLHCRFLQNLTIIDQSLDKKRI